MSTELAAMLGKRFIERRDTKAVQFRDGHYEPDRSTFTMTDLRAHLAGERTYGHYLISSEDRCRIIAFDIDLPKTCLLGEPPQLVEAIREMYLVPDFWGKAELNGLLFTAASNLAFRTRDLLGVPVAVSYSGGKGLHVYGFTGPVPSAEAHDAALAVIASYGDLWAPFRGDHFWRYDTDVEGDTGPEIEVFPKQGSLDGKDLGNLLRLPLGVNRKTGQSGFFVDMKKFDGGFFPLDPMYALEHGSL